MKLFALFTLSLFTFCGCSLFSSNGHRGPASTAGMDIRTVANLLRPFTANACPRFPGGIEYPNQEKWSLCCVQHDIAYWKGGSNDDRLAADKQLLSCLIEQNEPNAGALIYLGVRHMDMDTYPMTHRWGYGWILNRGYTPLSTEDKLQISRLEKNIPRELATVSVDAKYKSLITPKDSLTGNYCIDGVITFIHQQLHRSLTAMRVEHHIEADGEGFEETIKINDQLYPEPYEFKFFTNKRSACTIPPSRRASSIKIKIKSFNYK